MFILVIYLLFTAEFKKAFPEAKLIGVSGHLSKLHLKELNFDGGAEKIHLKLA